MKVVEFLGARVPVRVWVLGLVVLANLAWLLSNIGLSGEVSRLSSMQGELIRQRNYAEERLHDLQSRTSSAVPVDLERRMSGNPPALSGKKINR